MHSSGVFWCVQQRVDETHGGTRGKYPADIFQIFDQDPYKCNLAIFFFPFQLLRCKYGDGGSVTGVWHSHIKMWTLRTLMHQKKASPACTQAEAELSCFIHNIHWAYLWEHGQFLGKVHDTCDGRGHDLGELTEGFQVHLISIAGGHHRTLADVVRLETRHRMKKCYHSLTKIEKEKNNGASLLNRDRSCDERSDSLLTRVLFMCYNSFNEVGLQNWQQQEHLETVKRSQTWRLLGNQSEHRWSNNEKRKRLRVVILCELKKVHQDNLWLCRADKKACNINAAIRRTGTSWWVQIFLPCIFALHVTAWSTLSRLIIIKQAQKITYLKVL